MKTIHSSLLLITAFALGLFVHAASAQTFTWNAASGNWSNTLNWNPTGDPNTPSESAIFNNGGSLTLDASRNIGSYSQTGGTFTIVNGQSLLLNTSGTLAGGGVMNLGYSYIYQNAADVLFTVTNGTIQGFGEIGYNGLSLMNQANGIISANTAGQFLSLNSSGTFTNKGLMRAQNGGILVFIGSADVINNAATISSLNGSNVSIQTRIIGGTLDNTGSTGTFTLTNGRLRNVTIAAGSEVINGSYGRIENTLTNLGTLSSTNNQSIFVATNTTLSGGGIVALGYGYLYNEGLNRTLTNTNNTLRGYGQIGYDTLSVINGAAGIIQADVSPQFLYLNGGGTFTNNGLMRAQNGGTLAFSGTADVINNGTIRSLNGSNVLIQTRIVGGTLTNNASTGTITLNSGRLRNVTIAAGSTVTNANAGRIENTLVNMGTLSTTGSQSMFVASDTTLSGGGIIEIGHGYLLDNNDNRTLTNTNNVLRGYGDIGYYSLSVINGPAGIIQADVSAQPLNLNGSGTFTNNGLMRAQSGGELIFSGSADVINNAAIRSENGSNVSIRNRIVGGTLSNTGSTGTLTLNNGSLRNVTIAAGSSVTNGNAGHLENTLVNMGTLSSTGSQSIYVASDTTLSGGGTIAIGHGYLLDNNDNRTLTNTNNVLRGYGEIGYYSLSVINGPAGIIQADVSGQTLSLNGSGSFTNNGLFAARNGSTLLRSAGTFTNFSGSTLTGGAYFAIDATLNLNTGPIVFNDATVVLSGPTSIFSQIDSIRQNDGIFEITNGRNFSIPALPAAEPRAPASPTANAFTNVADLVIGPDSTFSVNGDYAQGSQSSLEIVLGADYPNASFHHMNVTGTAHLAGTLQVTLANGYNPAPNQTFEIISAGAIDSGFVNVIGATVTYTATKVIINPTGSPSALQLSSAVSRKTHGAAGIFDINVLNANFGPECRSSGGTHRLIFTFNHNVITGSASVTAGTGSVSGVTFAGNRMTVNLTGVTDVQKLTVTLSNVTDTSSEVLPNTAVSVNMLIGDTTANKSVNASDIGQTKSRSGQVTSATNFRSDTTVSGSINASDIGQVKANSGHSLP